VPNGSTRNGIEWGARTPVESREQRQAGVVNDVTVPILLAVAISIATALVWVAWLLVVRSLRGHVFWLFALLASLGLFFAPQLRRRLGELFGRRYSHIELDRMCIGTLKLGLLLTYAGGLFSLALWKVTRGLTIAQLALTSLPVGLTIGLLWLTISTGQETFFRSPFMEQALASLLNQEETPWHRQSQNQPQPVTPPPQRVQIEWVERENGRTMMRNYDDWPLDAEKTLWLARHIADGGSLSIPQCSGRGKPLSRNDVEEVRDWTIGKGFVEWVDADHPAQGVRIRSKGKALFAGLAMDGED
jgi:hypothetical protein